MRIANLWPFGRGAEAAPAAPALERRAVGAAGGAGSFTAQMIAARASYLAGSDGVGELTATVQGCVSLWEGAFALADVQGAPMLDRRAMALAARALALSGDAVFLARGDELVPCLAWDLSTHHGRPRAYRVTIADVGGGVTETVLAGEVLHFRIGADASAPWIGSAPLRRASLTAGMLEEVETALRDVYRETPIGSQIVPMPETAGVDLEQMGADFRGRRGRVLLRESVQVTAAGGPAPVTDWRAQDVTPDLSGVAPGAMLDASRHAILTAFGVLPSLHDRIAQGPLVREAQRHLAGWTLQPIAALMAEEAAAKLGTTVSIDVLRPLQAFDAGGRARAFGAIVEGIAKAKEQGLSGAELDAALSLVNWGDADQAA